MAEAVSHSEEDPPWEDEDWDWGWSAEPVTTYREAVDQLRVLMQGRADVRIDWDGQRGPKGDARIVFTGAPGNWELRARLRSATQLSDYTKVIESATLLPDRHALWYPGVRMITARLVGDYDQLHAAVARALVPRQRSRRFVPDSPIARDVTGILTELGAFTVAENSTPPSPTPRTIRLIYATEGLRLLYGPHGGEVPSVAIELCGFDAVDAAEAERLLVAYGTAYLFQLGKATGVSLRLWRSEYRLGGRRHQAYSGRVQFPRHCYDTHPAELYAAGNSAARDPVERYLKYYQVLEFYMTRAANSIAASQGVAINSATSPLPRPSSRNRLTSEQNMLDAVISYAVTSGQVLSLLGDNDLFGALSNPRVIEDVHVLSADSSGRLIAGHDYRVEISTRIYDLRNRIVHMKQGGGRSGQVLLAPYGREARDLAADLRLIRFLAEHALHKWAGTLP
jgi:hypothetical protein